MNAVADLIKGIENRASLTGVPMRDVLAAAVVDHSTWWRWKQGKNSPQLRTIQRVEAALEALTDFPK